jgi:hypothetical protein
MDYDGSGLSWISAFQPALGVFGREVLTHRRLSRVARRHPGIDLGPDGRDVRQPAGQTLPLLATM